MKYCKHNLHVSGSFHRSRHMNFTALNFGIVNLRDQFFIQTFRPGGEGEGGKVDF